MFVQARVAMEGRVRLHHQPPDETNGRFVRLVARIFTMHPGLSGAVTEVFVRLYREGLIYRGKRLVNWDPVLQTAVSDLEVSVEEKGFLGTFFTHLKSEDGRNVDEESPGGLIVATTRPETMLGDVAVAVHPDDARYRHLVGGQCGYPYASGAFQ